MTPPMTRPVTPVYWFVIVGMLGMFVAIPLGRRQDWLSWLGGLWIFGFAIGLWGWMIVGAIRTFLAWYRDKPSDDGNLEEGLCYGDYIYQIVWDRQRFWVRGHGEKPVVEVPLSRVLEVIDLDALFLEDEVRIQRPWFIGFPKSRSQRVRLRRFLGDLVCRDAEVRQEIRSRCRRCFRQGLVWFPVSLLLLVGIILFAENGPELKPRSLIGLVGGVALVATWCWALWRLAYAVGWLCAARSFHVMLRAAERGDSARSTQAEQPR